MKKFFTIFLSLVLVTLSLFWFTPTAMSATLSGGSATLSDSRTGQTSVTYTTNFDNVTTSAIKCIKVVFSDSASGGSVPTGMSTASVALNASTNYIPTPGSWAADGTTTNGTVKITYATGETPASSSDRTVVLTGITNGSTAETPYYVQFNTYNNADCSTSGVDSGIVVFVFTSAQAVSATVDPSLSFNIAAVASGQTVNGATTNVTTTDGTIPLGTITTSTNGIGAHDLTVTTNAKSGYTVTTKYTAAPTYGTATIDDHTGTNASPSTMSAGTEAFGYTTNDSSLGIGTADRFTSGGGNKWAKFTTSGLEVAYNSAAVSDQPTRTGYQMGISATTEAGNYTTTVVMVCTPTY